jgi:23S rRNA (cytidine1920-2'-O)/16S rRNA (cytidine1409-2'-O)-methyltransferase
MLRRGMVRSRSEAQNLIEEGKVVVDGVDRPKPASSVTAETPIELTSPHRFASRAGQKLADALESFRIDVEGKRVVDAGASTGGFTDCLLQRGAEHVVAVDVGRDQIRPELRGDTRVTVFEGMDIGQATAAILGGPFDLVVADLSFVSLCRVAPALAALAKPAADVIALVKPQFEVGKAWVGRGVVRDPVLRQAAVDQVRHCFEDAGLDTVSVMESPVTGEHGNREFMLWARKP